MKMKAALVVLALVGTLAAAEPRSSTKTEDTAQNPVPVKIVGCLQGTSGQYRLFDNSGRMYNLAGGEALLAPGLHAQVEITGTVSDPGGSFVPAQAGNHSGLQVSESSTNAGTNNTGTGTSANGNVTVNVSGAKIVSPTCDDSN